MCGRCVLSTPPDELAELFGLSDPPPYEARFNIAPSQPLLALREATEATEATERDAARDRARAGHAVEWALLRWGLVPRWAPDPTLGQRLVNARVETIASRSAFRDSLRERRAVVLVDGFYEWSRRRDDGADASRATRGRRAVPHFVHAEDEKPLALAALWDRWEPRGEPPSPALETVCIITRPSLPPVAALHDRMPLIVPRALLDAWLSGELDVDALVARSSGERLRLHPVGKRVNDARFDDPSCVTPEPTSAEEAPVRSQLSLFSRE
jgi:putative SOS response-associated peptidase YedK